MVGMYACPVSCKSADKWKKFMRLFKFRQGAPLSKAWYDLPSPRNTFHFTGALYEIWHACYWCSDLPVLSIVFPVMSLWHPVLDQFWAFNPLWAGVVISLLSRRVSSSLVWVVSGHVIIPPASAKLKAGYTGFTLSLYPSVCPSVFRIVSALHLPQYWPDPFIFTHLINLLHIFKNKFSTKVVDLYGLVWSWNNGLINTQIRLSTTLTYTYYCKWLIYSVRCCMMLTQTDMFH